MSRRFGSPCDRGTAAGAAGFLARAALVVCASCGPRGETVDLATVRDLARREFETSLGARTSGGGDTARTLPPPVTDALKTTTALLDRLAPPGRQPSGDGPAGPDPAAVSAAVRDVSANLRTLAVSAGYTSRPAFGEIIDQYESVAVRAGGTAAAAPTAPELTLLAARTYSLLASELDGVAFGLGTRELKR